MIRKLAGHLKQWVRSVSIVAIAAVVMLMPGQALALTNNADNVQGRAGSSERQAFFEAAADQYGVPAELLLAVSYNLSRWENHQGRPSVSGGYGLMHLTLPTSNDEDRRGDPARPMKTPSTTPLNSLSEAVMLTGIDPEVIKANDQENIKAGAALFAKYAKESNGGQLPSSINDWYAATMRLSGATDASLARDFADSVYKTVEQGASHITTDGQKLVISPLTVSPNKAQGSGDAGLPESLSHKGGTESNTQPECPRTIVCKFAPARYAQNNPVNPADYGNYDVTNRPRDMKIKYIVIHDTEGSYQSAISWFQDPRSYVAAHYVIRSSDGEVTQMVKNKDTGWHAGNWYMNMHSIGVEHEGYAEEGATWYTDAMYRSSAKLVRYLAEKYDIPLDRQHIVAHEQYHGLTPARAKLMHNDPGPYWDWDYYMSLLRYGDGKRSDSSNRNNRNAYGWNHHGRPNAVRITPNFATNKPVVSQCVSGVCTDLPSQSANFVYLRTEPRSDAPLVTDVGLHPDGGPGTTDIDDGSARAIHGQTFVVADKQEDWLAVWFGGQKAWFYSPSSWRDRTATPAYVKRVTPKAGKTSIPIYGRPVPEPRAYKNGVPPLTPVPLQYTVPAGQSYVAYDMKAANDYMHILTFDRSSPGDGTLVIGEDRYIPIEYNHRQAFVKASDVDVRWR